MEHAILWAFVVLVIAIIVNGMSSVNMAWGIANTQLSSEVVSTSQAGANRRHQSA
jgi:hypothetical protein